MSGSAPQAGVAAAALKRSADAAVEHPGRNSCGQRRQIAATACRPAQVARDCRRNNECRDPAGMTRCNTVCLAYGVGNRIFDHDEAGIHATGPAYPLRLVQTRNHGDLPYHHAPQSRSQKLTAMAVGSNNKNDVRTPQRLHHRRPTRHPARPNVGHAHATVQSETTNISLFFQDFLKYTARCCRLSTKLLIVGLRIDQAITRGPARQPNAWLVCLAAAPQDSRACNETIGTPRKSDSFHLTRGPGSDCTRPQSMTHDDATCLSSRSTAFNMNSIPPRVPGGARVSWMS